MLGYVIYDGDCIFCKKCVDRWSKETLGLLEYQPYQSGGSVVQLLSLDELENAVHFVILDQAGTDPVEKAFKIYSGAEAVFRIKKIAKKGSAWLWVYQSIPLTAQVFELGYSWVARNRVLVSRVFSRCPF